MTDSETNSAEGFRVYAMTLLVPALHILAIANLLALSFVLLSLFLNESGSLDPSLFVPSMILVAGSFGVYFLRRKHDRERLESAILTEIENLDEIENMKQNLDSLDDTQKPPDSPIPSRMISPSDSFPTTVYQENATEIGRLESPKASEIVTFYSKLEQMKSIIVRAQSIRSQKKASEGGTALDELDSVEIALHKRLKSLIEDLHERQQNLQESLSE